MQEGTIDEIVEGKKQAFKEESMQEESMQGKQQGTRQESMQDQQQVNRQESMTKRYYGTNLKVRMISGEEVCEKRRKKQERTSLKGMQKVI